MYKALSNFQIQDWSQVAIQPAINWTSMSPGHYNIQYEFPLQTSCHITKIRFKFSSVFNDTKQN
jgi:hypothetical protein